MPIFVNSPDFEPDSARQSLILNGITRDEEKNVITEVGINQKILCKLPDMFKIIVEYLSEKSFNCFFNLCNGLKSLKDHEKLDKDWYKKSIILVLREILTSYPIVTPYSTAGARRGGAEGGRGSNYDWFLTERSAHSQLSHQP